MNRQGQRSVKLKTSTGIDTIISYRDNVVHRIVHKAASPFGNYVSVRDRGRDVDAVLQEQYSNARVLSDSASE